MKRLAIIFMGLFMYAVSAFAIEKTGDLIFRAVQKIQKTDAIYYARIERLQAEHNQILKDLDSLRQQYRAQRTETLKQELQKHEIHARYCYKLSQLYSVIRQEAWATKEMSRKNTLTLRHLRDTIVKNGGTASPHLKKILETMKPVWKRSEQLMLSLTRYKDKIKDPVINQKLNLIYRIWVQFQNKYGTDSQEIGGMGSRTTLLLKQIDSMIAQMEAVYMQSDLFLSAVEDRARMLKVINELAIAELGAKSIDVQSEKIGELPDKTILPLYQVLNSSDTHLDTLADGVLNNNGVGGGKNNTTSAQQWVNIRNKH